MSSLEHLPDHPADERGRLVAGLLRPALAEQRRICLFACEDFPREDDCLGRDLTQLTIVQSDPERAEALRNHFGHMIVVETEEMQAFLERQRLLGEGFDLIIVPDLEKELADVAHMAMIRALVACLRPGGRVALIASQRGTGSAGQDFAELVKLAGLATSNHQLSCKTSGDNMLVVLTRKD